MKSQFFSKISKFLILLVFTCLSFSFTTNKTASFDNTKVAKSIVLEKFNALPANAQDLNFNAFELAFKAYMNTQLSNNNILTIIDFTKPSNQKRFYVIDIKANKLLYKTFTSHGKNTGYQYAKNFSNIPESKQSSLGFFKTGQTYYGKHGFSLRLHGVEKNINHKAYERAIVIHGADYMSDDFIAQHNRAGRSWGCPALPRHLSKEIINTIKNGSGLFIYANNADYKKKSKFIQ